ncbi:hypothetical protein FRC11_006929 [Ceratobasidium sp. 423]|nr:hypothetical protein FRC11_006929 [Ceratobasidium sp. 423]
MVFYVNRNNFNIKDRKPMAPLADGTFVTWIRYSPLQSDITTFLSVLLALLRLITACWLGPLCWRCAFILMEQTGLRPQNLHILIAYGFPTMGLPRKHLTSYLIWVVLAIVLPIHLIAPILTGSITWVPSSHRPEHLANSNIGVATVTEGGGGRWYWWQNYDSVRERIVIIAGGFANTAWGRDSPYGTLKRVLPSSSFLETNSTISNVTIPYFSVHSIQWISNPLQTLTPDELHVDNIACRGMKLYVTECPLWRQQGTIALVPPTNLTFRTTPTPETVSETRLLVMNVEWRETPTSNCTGKTDTWRPNYPPLNVTVFPEPDRYECLAAAWVTYTAGAATCHGCRISSYTTVQNDSPIQLEKHPMTIEALQMMPSVISSMILMNTSLPSAENRDSYTIELLTRSYAASWNALVEWVGNFDPRLNSTYSVAIQSSQAIVNSKRVGLWVGLQCLITVSGILFLLVQASTGNSMVCDTTLTAFYLDSSDVYEDGKYEQLQNGGLLRLKYDNGHTKVKVE